MRVLIISAQFRGGGAERSARELYESLQEAGQSASMLVAIRKEGDPPLVSQLRLPGERWLQVARKVCRPADWINIGSKRALRRVNPGNCDVVHFHNVHGYWMSIKALQDLCKRMPSIWTLHDEWGATGGLCYDLSHVQGKYGREIRDAPDTELYFPDTPLARRYRRFLDRWLPQPNLLICPSLYMQRLAQQSGRFPNSEFARVPYGLKFKDLAEAGESRSEARRKFGLGPDERVVLLVAAHLKTFYKGISLAIDALRELPSTGFKVVIMGRGGEEIARLIPQKAVTTGFLSNDQMIAAAYRAADATLIPSIADNFPYVALESMACATPLIAFRVGGLTELIGENERGLLASPFDVSEFGRNIMRLIDSAELRGQLGNAGREWVDQNCDFKKWVNTHVGLYKQAFQAFYKNTVAAPVPGTVQSQ